MTGTTKSSVVGPVGQEWAQKQIIFGSGCGSVGSAVASDSRGLQFESSHRRKFILNIYCQLF